MLLLSFLRVLTATLAVVPVLSLMRCQSLSMLLLLRLLVGWQFLHHHRLTRLTRLFDCLLILRTGNSRGGIALSATRACARCTGT